MYKLTIWTVKRNLLGLARRDKIIIMTTGSIEVCQHTIEQLTGWYMPLQAFDKSSTSILHAPDIDYMVDIQPLKQR